MNGAKMTSAQPGPRVSQGFRRSASTLVILFAVVALTIIGVIVLFSATHVRFADPYAMVRKQVIWLAIAIGVGTITALLNLERLRLLAWPAAVATAGSLALVLLPGIGVEVNGSQRWLRFGAFNVQPSEMGKLALVFLLAHYLGANQRHLGTFFKGFLVPITVIGVLAFLVLLEPDFGNAFLLGLTGVVIMFLAGCRLRYLLPAGVLAVSLFSLAIMFDPVRMRRITSFLDLEANKTDGAYQLWQGILAFGAGGIGGVGLGNGRQQNAFLPEAHTDFIFPIIGEELGFIFSGAVVGAFILIFVVCLWRMRRAPNLYQFLFVSGALLMITFQALINFGVVTGCLPTKGMSLPFISYGGSNLLCMFVFVGIIVNCFNSWGRLPLRNPLNL